MAKKRAESRTRYFIRTQSLKRRWNVSHISKGGDFVEEQEIVNSFPDCGLGLEKPDEMQPAKRKRILKDAHRTVEPAADRRACVRRRNPDHTEASELYRGGLSDLLRPGRARHSEPLAAIIQCAPMACFTSGGRIHPDSCR